MKNQNQARRDPLASGTHIFYQPELSEGVHSLPEDETHHALRVLRLSKGDPITITDGKGLLAKATISEASKTSCSFTINEQSIVEKKPYSIHLLIAPTKNSDRMEWLVEKAAELGVDRITMVRCEHSERKHVGHERLVKMAVSAMKQSQQSWLTQVDDLTPFNEAISSKHDQKFIAYVDYSNPSHLKNVAEAAKSYGLLIGPEGDFSKEELELAMSNGWTKVSLGKTRLRTETAGLTGSLILKLVNE